VIFVSLYDTCLVQALDLMAKMLGFTEDEKQRVNEAASRLRGGGAVVRGVLNLLGSSRVCCPRARGFDARDPPPRAAMAL